MVVLTRWRTGANWFALFTLLFYIRESVASCFRLGAKRDATRKRGAVLFARAFAQPVGTGQGYP